MGTIPFVNGYWPHFSAIRAMIRRQRLSVRSLASGDCEPFALVKSLRSMLTRQR